MCITKIFLFAVALLLSSCFNIADVNWRAELANTHWSNCNTNEQFKARGSHLNLQVERYVLVDNKIVPSTILNEAGLQIMESDGCLGCHQGGGVLSSTMSVKRYKESGVSVFYSQQNR